jgi:hypothetical protein
MARSVPRVADPSIRQLLLKKLACRQQTGAPAKLNALPIAGAAE